MTYTGGELNVLNGKYGISAPQNSVPVMKLIRVHKPKSKSALYELIKEHYEKNCSCGIVSKGTIEDFGKHLYDVQVKEWGKYKYSLKECIQWEYDLFVIQSLKGNKIETNARKILNNRLFKFEIIESKGFIDEELRIDLIVLKDEKEICGIQVKPQTFNFTRTSVINFNKNANRKWGKPVFYLFYDDNENFTNLDDIVIKITGLI